MTTQLRSSTPAVSAQSPIAARAGASSAAHRRVPSGPPPATTKLFKSLGSERQPPTPLHWSTPDNPTPGPTLPACVPEGDLLLNGVGAFKQYGEPIGHWFDGTGYVQRFSLKRGSSHHEYRRMDAPQNRLERALNRSVMGAINGKAKGGMLGNALFGLRNACNTNVIVTPAGELQARFEAYPPTRLRATDLQALGSQHFGGGLPAGAHLSAHPARHVDGSLWDFHLDHMSQTLNLYRTGAGDVTHRHVQATMPYNGFIHDIVATEHHVVAVLTPLVYPAPPTELPVWARRAIVKTAALGMTQTPMDILKWEAKLGTYIGIFSLGEDKAVRWVKTPDPFFTFHLANAFEKIDGSIAVDACVYDNAGVMWGMAHDMQSRAVNGKLPYITRFTVDADDQVSVRKSEHTLELPDMLATVRGVKSAPFFGLTYKNTVAGVPACYDPETDKLTVTELAPGDYASTPVLLNDRTLATVVSNVERGDSTLHLYDIATFGAAPPVATAKLAEQLPPTFHGVFSAIR